MSEKTQSEQMQDLIKSWDVNESPIMVLHGTWDHAKCYVRGNRTYIIGMIAQMIRDEPEIGILINKGLTEALQPITPRTEPIVIDSLIQQP